VRLKAVARAPVDGDIGVLLEEVHDRFQNEVNFVPVYFMHWIESQG